MNATLSILICILGTGADMMTTFSALRQGFTEANWLRLFGSKWWVAKIAIVAGGVLLLGSFGALDGAWIIGVVGFGAAGWNVYQFHRAKGTYR